MDAARGLLVVFLLAVLSYGMDGVPLGAKNGHKIFKRAAVVGSASAAKENEKAQAKTSSTTEAKDGQNENVQKQPEDSMPLAQDEESNDQSLDDTVVQDDGNGYEKAGDRVFDWKLLSGDKAELDRELETRRRRRRSARPLASLGRQHRVRSRSKRNAYYLVDPSDLALDYEYMAPRAQRSVQSPLQDGMSDQDLAYLAALIYELQSLNDASSRVEQEEAANDLGSDQRGPYVLDERPYYRGSLDINPAVLQRMEADRLSGGDGDQYEGRAYYPKYKRAVEPILYQDDSDDDGVEQQLGYMPIRVPVDDMGYDPRYYYEVDGSSLPYDVDGLTKRRADDEDELRQRIAELVDDINEQRIMRRRR